MWMMMGIVMARSRMCRIVTRWVSLSPSLSSSFSSFLLLFFVGPRRLDLCVGLVVDGPAFSSFGTFVYDVRINDALCCDCR
jgi:hypothetical protein